MSAQSTKYPLQAFIRKFSLTGEEIQLCLEAIGDDRTSFAQILSLYSDTITDRSMLLRMASKGPNFS